MAPKKSEALSALDAILASRAGRNDLALEEVLTLPEYLDRVVQNPSLCRRANTRLYEMIMSHGTETYKEFGRKRTHFKFIDDPFDGRDALFGMDIAFEKFMIKMRSAAYGGAAERRILLMHGPVGSAKSTVARLLKKGLEHYSKTDAGAMYTFRWIRAGELAESDYDEIYGKGVAFLDAPMNHDPIYLIDEGDRKAISDLTEGKIVFKGGLDPLSTFVYNKLLAAVKGDWARLARHVQVRRIFLSEANRVGIGSFQPKDEKNQDATELTGTINFRRIAIYGSDSDPRAFNFDGEFQVANRGIIEFVELLKLERAFLYDLLTASEEGKIKPKKFAQCDVDTVILGHNNEPELKKLEADKYMEAFRNRTVTLQFPYVTKTTAESQIYRRDIGRLPIHIAPHTYDVASMFSVASRLDKPKGANATRMQKAKLYDGQHVDGFTDETVREMRKESPREGMDGGISPRTIQDIFDNITTENMDRGCVNPFNFLRNAQATIERLPLPNADQRADFIALLGDVEAEYNELAQTDVQRAIAADPTQAQEVWERYLDNAEAFLNKTKVRNPTTGREEDPDEKLMSALEEKANIRTANKADFRQTTMSWIGQQMRKGTKVDYTSNDTMRKAIERYLFDKQKDTIHLSTLVTPGAISPETQKKIDVVKQRLIDDYGYCETCAKDVLAYVASIFARGEAK